ncbi:MAG: alpha/beta hydrolase [Acidimicrobiales bacterium]|nr:alpha/beta hydrolase [Acidimicrobiales bacterium]
MTKPTANRPPESITLREQREVDAANESGRVPVVFVHGLWLLASSWDPWRTRFENDGYVTLAPGWPDDPDTVELARAKPEVFARKSIRQIADHLEAVIRGLAAKPVIIGHSFGGLLTEILAGRGLGRASVAISPAPARGVLPVPFSALRVASVVLRNPLNRRRAVPLSYEQFRYGFANALTESEAQRLYEEFSVAGSGVPLFQAVAANVNPWTEAKAHARSASRGPMLIIGGQRDHTVPGAIAKSTYKLQRHNQAPTKFITIPNRGHSLTIDAGWREVADAALAFVDPLVRDAAASRSTLA